MRIFKYNLPRLVRSISDEIWLNPLSGTGGQATFPFILSQDFGARRFRVESGAAKFLVSNRDGIHLN
jgi:hypothetical protein